MLETLQETLGHRPAQCSCCATDRKDRHDCPGCKARGAQVLICKHCESKHWIDHKLVTPINSERSVQCKTSSVEASRRASPPGLRVRKLIVDLAFALAEFKVQGKRCQLRTTLTTVVLSRRFHVPLEQLRVECTIKRRYPSKRRLLWRI